jgi:hypothetical protein
LVSANIENICRVVDALWEDDTLSGRDVISMMRGSEAAKALADVRMAVQRQSADNRRAPPRGTRSKSIHGSMCMRWRSGKPPGGANFS